MAATLTAQPEPAAAPKAAGVPAALADHFAVLSEPSGASGVESIGGPNVSAAAAAELSERASRGISEQFGLNAALARRVTYGQTHLWVIPGSAGICLQDYEAGAGGVCGPTANAVAGKTAVDVGGDEHGVVGGGTVYGLAPNGNSTVLVRDANGSSEHVLVEHNVYVVTHPGAVSVQLTDGSGQVRTYALPG